MKQTIRRLEFELTITNAQGHSGYVTPSTHVYVWAKGGLAQDQRVVNQRNLR